MQKVKPREAWATAEPDTGRITFVDCQSETRLEFIRSYGIIQAERIVRVSISEIRPSAKKRGKK